MSGYKENIASTDSNNRVFDQDTPSKGELPRSAARKPLPPPLYYTSRSELAAWEQDIHAYAIGLENIQSPGANASGSTLTICRELCERWGYYWPELQEEKSVVSQVWRLLPPTKGQVKVVSGRGLEKFIADSLKRSLAERTYLGKEMFYLNHAWPGGSNQTDGEIKILKTLAPELVNRVRVFPTLSIYELGAGNSTKIIVLLDLLEPLGIKCCYHPVDINKKSLDETVRLLNERYTNVECSGVHGTFEDGVAMAATQAGKKVIISLGSTVINFDRTKALENLQELCRGDNLVVLGHQGPDGVTGPDGIQVHRGAYHTKQFEEFIWQGLLETGNEILRKKVFNNREWKIGCAIASKDSWSHEFVFYHRGEERFRAFSSTKFSEQEVSGMFKAVGAPSPEIYRHPETAMRIYVADCAGASTNRKEFVLPVDIAYFRHCESVSGIRGIESGFDLRTSSEEQTRRFVTDANNDKGVHIFNGDYCKDGVTSEGQKQAAQKLPYPFDNVYCVVSSPCARPYQSGCLTSPSFNMEESQAGKAGKPVIHIDRRLREATSWPQDFEPILRREGDRVYSSYFEVIGGNGRDAGRVVGETKVDFTDAIWREDGMQRTLPTIDARMEALEHPETLDEVKQRLASFLKDEFIAAKENYKEHTESGKKGTPKRVWMGHGGALNLLEGKFHCEYTQGADGCWGWKSSAALGYGEVRVFNLCLDGDGTVALKEKPWDSHYAKVFGSRYRHFESDPSLQYRHSDGSPVDQEKDYEAFFSHARDEVIKVVQEKRTALSVLQGWEAS